MYNFSKIGLFCKQQDPRISETLERLQRCLSKRSLELLASETAGELMGIKGHGDSWLADNINLAIVVGGDGTLLQAGRVLVHRNIPVIGINLGRVGFLVDINPDDLDKQLTAMLSGEFIEEPRTLLQAEVFRGKKSLGSGDALNDVVVHVRNDVRMIEFDIRVNGDYVNTQRADGIVIATPTGSTAYALSAGGPILHPGQHAVVLVPICSHTLSNRPIVVNSNSIIEVELNDARQVTSRLSFDGQSNINLRSGDRIRIQQHPHQLRLLHPENYDYYQILRSKLGWNAALD